MPATKKKRARRASILEQPYVIDELEFRPFTAATPEHFEALGISAELEKLADAPDDDPAWIKIITAIAWTLHAPLADVNDLAFAADEAETKEEKAAVQKQFRRAVLEFQSQLSAAGLAKVARRINNEFERQMNLEFDIIDRDSSASEDRPPGNS